MYIEFAPRAQLDPVTTSISAKESQESGTVSQGCQSCKYPCTIRVTSIPHFVVTLTLNVRAGMRYVTVLLNYLNPVSDGNEPLGEGGSLGHPVMKQFYETALEKDSRRMVQG